MSILITVTRSSSLNGFKRDDRFPSRAELESVRVRVGGHNVTDLGV